MRNRVVNVQQIEVVAFGDIRHARRERQAIRRVLEQRIVGNFHFVVVDARNAGIEPDRIRVGDEVNLVAARREFEAEFGGDDPAAAVGGIAGDADSQGSPVLHRSGCRGRACGCGLRHRRGWSPF